MNYNYLRTGLSVTLGLGFGAAWGAALDHVAFGMVLGVSLGTIFGAALSIAPDAPPARSNPAADKPLPRPLGL